jgi:SAM-dependent methyltransferase
MAKSGEIDYLKNHSPEGVWHAVHKPFSDKDCAGYLFSMGAVFSLLPPRPARLLDLGCGTGWTSLFYARAGYEVVGADIAPDMIHHAEQMRREARLDNVRFVVSDYEEMPFTNEFDGVVFHDALHHAVDEELAVRRAFQALRPGGCCLTVEPGEGHHNSEHAREAVRRFGVTEKDMPPAKIIDLGRRTGFRSFRVYPRISDNFLVDYHTEPAPAWSAARNPFKGLFHRLLRFCLRLDRGAYEATVFRYRHLAGLRRTLYRDGGIVLMVK